VRNDLPEYPLFRLAVRTIGRNIGRCMITVEEDFFEDGIGCGIRQQAFQLAQFLLHRGIAEIPFYQIGYPVPVHIVHVPF